MARVFEPNYAGFVELRNSPEVKSLIENAAKQVQSNASGTGCSCEIKTHSSGGSQSRAWASVYPVDIESKINNSKDNSLLKAIGSAKV